MSNVLIAALATACVLTAFESLILPLGKWRGLVALLFSTLSCLIIGPLGRITFFAILAATFVGLTMSLIVEQTFTGMDSRQLPRRVPKI